jgi:hypothetical protein
MELMLASIPERTLTLFHLRRHLVFTTIAASHSAYVPPRVKITYKDRHTSFAPT